MNDYYDSRQHLNLSRHAYDVIENDKFEFLEKPSRQRVINMILAAYVDDADAAIDNALIRYEERLRAQLSMTANTAEKEALLRALVNAYRQELIDQVKRYPKECPFKVQLDRSNYAAMLEWHDNGGYYDDTPGKFYKAVIEEYAQKPIFEREEILLRNLIDEIQICISLHQLVIITLNGPRQNRYEVRPFSVCADAGRNYHYLVGYSKKAGTDYPERPVSFRVSRIKEIKRSHARSGKITEKQKYEIDKKLQTDGVQFLLQDAEPICIKLSGNGKKLYESTAHLRPPFLTRVKGADGNWLYTFQCTQLQAEYYFFKFGPEAEVLSPLALRSRFANRYGDARTIYSRVISELAP